MLGIGKFLSEKFGRTAPETKPAISAAWELTEADLNGRRIGLDPAYGQFPNIRLTKGYALVPTTRRDATFYELIGNPSDEEGLKDATGYARNLGVDIKETTASPGIFQVAWVNGSYDPAKVHGAVIKHPFGVKSFGRVDTISPRQEDMVLQLSGNSRVAAGLVTGTQP
jgi:hypothetical protein